MFGGVKYHAGQHAIKKAASTYVGAAFFADISKEYLFRIYEQKGKWYQKILKGRQQMTV